MMVVSTCTLSGDSLSQVVGEISSRIPRSLASAALPSSRPTICGAATLAAQGVVELGGDAPDLGEVAQRLLGTAELEQPGDRVHPVGELVLLGAQRVGETAFAVQLAAVRRPARCGREA